MSFAAPDKRLRVVMGSLWVWLVLHAASVAQACSVCTAGREEENQVAFLLSTIFMSLMPLIAIGTIVFVIWRRIRRIEAEQAARQPACGPLAAAQPATTHYATTHYAATHHATTHHATTHHATTHHP